MNINMKVFNAIDFATKAHERQIRKTNGLPKIVHLYSVAMILSNYNYEEDIIISGLLHDVLEDCKNITKDDIIKNFGDKVAKCVLEVTEPSKNIEWKERKQKHIQHMKYANFGSKVVCAADKIHNLIGIEEELKVQGETVWEKFNAPKEDILWYYSSMCDSIIFGYQNDNIPIFNDLKDIVERFILKNKD